MKKSFIFLFLALIIVSSAFVLAAGSGGGGVRKSVSSAKDDDKDQRMTVTNPVTDIDKNVSTKRELPEQASRGKGLKCGHLSTVRERVSCRLKLGREEAYEDNEISFLPEECRALEGGKQEKCIDKYNKTQRCWKFPVGDERIKCVKENLELKKSHKDEKLECRKLDGEEKGRCVQELKDKSYDLIKFRFYDLEERAEELKEKGVANEDDVVELVAALEEKKIEFNNASTIKEKKRIILEVRKIWKDFVKKIREGAKVNAE